MVKQEITFTKEKIFNCIMRDFGTPTSYVPMKSEQNPNCEYACIRLKGNCLDSPNAPMRIKDNDCIVIHKANLFNPTISGKTICVQLKDVMMTKYCRFYNGIRNVLTLEQFNPSYQFDVSFSDIKAVYIVDEVVEI